MRADSTRALLPLDPGYAAIALDTTADREEIFELLLRGSRSRTRFAAVLLVHGNHLEIRRVAAAEGLKTDGLDALEIPRTVELFEKVLAVQTAMVGAPATGEPFVDGMVEMLGGAAVVMLAAPILVEGRVAALLVAHRGPSTFGLDDVEELVPLVDAAGDALTRGLRARTRAATVGTADGEPQPAARNRVTTIGASRDDDGAYDVEIVIARAQTPTPSELPAEAPVAKPELEEVEHRTTLAELRDKGAWRELADAIRDVIAIGIETGEPDEDEQLELLVELGQVEAGKLGRHERAIEAWQSALTIDGGDARAQQALYDLLASLDRWGECAALLEQRVAMAELPSARIGFLLELARIGERLGDDERANFAYEQILKWDPEHPAGDQLEARYTARRQWEPLAAMLLDRVERASTETGLAALEQVARLYEERLSDPHAALLVWMTAARKLQTIEPIVEVQRLAPKLEAWDEVIAEGISLAEDLAAAGAGTAASAWWLVGEWARDHGGDGNTAVRAFEQALHLETDRSRRCEIAVALGQLAESAGDGARASAWYETAVDNEPDARAPLLALHRLYRARRAWEPLAELLPRIAAVDPATPAERSAAVALHVERGRILGNRLGRHDEAVKAFRAALELEPGHVGALQGIARASAATGHTEMMLEAAEAALAASESIPDAGRPVVSVDKAAPDESGAFVDRSIPIAAMDRGARIAKLGDIAQGWYDLGRYERAADTWRKQLEAKPDPITQFRLADCLDRQVGDVEGAIIAYTGLLAGSPNDRRALDALARLHDRAGRADQTLDALRRLLELTTAAQPKARADVFERMASVYSGAGDHANARLNLVQALALDLDNAAAHEGMARVQLAQDELVAAGESLVKSASLSVTQADKLRRLTDAAWVFRHRIKDAARAKDCLEEVLAIDPGHRDAKEALAGLLADTQRWASLRDHMAPELARARRDGELPPDERRDILLRAARCALELDEQVEAIDLYDLACKLDPTPATLLERADALEKVRKLPAAAAAYRSLLTEHALDDNQTIDVCRRLADIQLAQAKPSAARPWLLKLLELAPGDQRALTALADLAIALRQFDEAISHLRTLVGLDGTAVDRIGQLERIGDLYRDQLGNPPRAMSAYLEALELDPKNRRVLQRVLDLQTETGQWRGAVETIGKFLAHEAGGINRAAYHLAEAEIRRVELKDRPGALDAYDRALDELFSEPVEASWAANVRTRALATFRTIDELLTADRDWPRLEQAYLRMVKRVPEDRRLLVVLWHALGEIYRSRLERFDHAIDAFEVAQSIEHSTERGRFLAELYQRTGRSAPEAQATPDHPDAYRERMHAAIEAGNIDGAWCAARALVVSKQATADEATLYARFKSREGDKATGVLDATAWHLVRHPDEDIVVSAIFALIWQGPVSLLAGPTKTFDLKPRERMPVEDGTRVIAKLFRHAARVLDTTLPEVYVQPRRPGRLLLANCVEKGRLLPAVIVGRDLIAGYRDTELASVVGSMLALLRPSYYLRLTLPTDDLVAAFAAAAAIGGRPDLVSTPQSRTSQFATEIESRLTNTTRIHLIDLVGRLASAPDLSRWCEAVDMTAHRAGLLVCGELAAALRMLATGSAAAGPNAGVRMARRARDLVSYSVSQPYFAARAQLGVTVA